MKKMALVLAALALSTSSFALESGISETGLSYNEVGVGYTSTTTNSGTIFTGTSSGLDVGGQALLTKNIFAFGSYGIPSGTYNIIGNVDSTNYQAGLGLRAAVASNVDVNLTATYLNSKASFLGISNIYTGYATGASVRALITPKLEANIGISYYDTKNERAGSSSATQYRIGTGYQFSDKIMGRAGYITQSNGDGYSVSLTYMF
jgi:hypothetical protein